MKTCTKCGKAKPTTEFSKHVGRRDGLQSNCKACDAVSKAAYAVENTEKIKASNAKYRAVPANRERAASGNAKWRAANHDRNKANKAKWVAANPGKNSACKAKWQADNPETRRINEHARRARKRELGGKLSPDISRHLLLLQRGKCACGCKQPLGDDFHIDHRMPLALGGVNEDWNVQLLRNTCNLQKGAKHPVDFMQQRGFLI